MKANQISFGVEIECYLPNSAATRGNSHLGQGAEINWAPEGWGGKPDGSLGSNYPGYTPVECVSPILTGEEGLAELFYMVEAIKEMNGKVDRTTGLHIHVDARSLTAAQVEAVKATFIKFEKAFYGLCGPQAATRMAGTYSKCSDQWLSHYNRTDRYRSLNLTNYYSDNPSKKTIEFRVWNGTLDVAVVIAAVYMAVALVSRVTEVGADEGSQIVGFEDAVNQFVKTFWAAEDYRIVPDATVNEIARTAKKASRKADGR